MKAALFSSTISISILTIGLSSAKAHLRGGRQVMSLPEPQVAFGHRSQAAVADADEPSSGRDLASLFGTLTIHNNCDEYISNFKAYYNANYIESQKYQIPAGASISLDNVDGTEPIHFYGLDVQYNSDIQDVVVKEVASAAKTSTLLHVISFPTRTAGMLQFPAYMSDIDTTTWVLNLCPPSSFAQNSQTTTASTTAATSTSTSTSSIIEIVSATTTAKDDTGFSQDNASVSTSTTPTAFSAATTGFGTLTVYNNCDKDITNFKAYYNANNVQSEIYGITAGEYILLDNVDGSVPIHFYGFHVQYDPNIEDVVVTEVASAPKISTLLHVISFPTRKSGMLQFPAYMADIDTTTWVLNLCPSSFAQNSQSATTSTTASTTATTSTAVTTPSKAAATAPATVPAGWGTLTVYNNCDKDITNFKAYYNANNVQTQTYGILAGEYIRLDNVNGNLPIHFYGFHVQYDSSIQDVVVIEVASATKTSTLLHAISFPTFNSGMLQFPAYMSDIDTTTWVLNLCPISSFAQNAQGVATTSTVAATSVSAARTRAP